ncbi:protein TsetseEP-like [Meriones unguiculatus]|uniref:protein TsetseEP-like n=1 Tax=Meriones unguiculatus TaxID=10047 RepID=UPI00293E9332|nr:protein TsetseEP-like [Meriones unguiculatus]
MPVSWNKHQEQRCVVTDSDSDTGSPIEEKRTKVCEISNKDDSRDEGQILEYEKEVVQSIDSILCSADVCDLWCLYGSSNQPSSEPKPEPLPESELEPDQELQPLPETEPQAEHKPQPKPNLQPEPEQEPEPEPEGQLQPEP